MAANDLAQRVEREAKLVPAPDFELSRLEELADGLSAVALEPQELVATYFDTHTLTLARNDITVRHRTGEGEPVWTLKVPSGSLDGALVRREVTVPGERNRRPREVGATVASHLRGRRLTAVALLETSRRGVELVDDEGAAVVLVTFDLVSASAGRRPLGSWEEIEVEATDHPDAPDALRRVVAALRGLGCSPADARPKLVRALGADAQAPPEVAPAELGHDPSVAQAVHAALTRSVAQILRHDPLVRLGGDPEDLHQLRVALRRLRSDLKTFAEIIDPDLAEGLRQELGWIAKETNQARDLDVLQEWLTAQRDTLPPDDRVGLDALLARAQGQEAEAQVAVQRGLSSSRYLDLVHRLVLLVDEPPAPTGAKRDRRARKHLRRRVEQRMHQLDRAIGKLGRDPSPPDLHRARIAAKRARAAVEAVRPLEGSKAKHLARSLADLQDLLGAVHDAHVFESWLRQVDGPAAAAFVAGELTVLASTRAAQLTDGWPTAWKRVRKHRFT